MNSKDKIFPEKLSAKRVKHADLFRKFGGHSLFCYEQLGVLLPPSIKKRPNLHPVEFCPPHFCILSMKNLPNPPLMLFETEH